MAILIAKGAILTLAIIVLAGGIMGFVKAKSKASLISGVISFIFLAASYALTYVDVRLGMEIGFSLILILEGLFGWRWFKTKKAMPALPMIAFCAVGLAAVVFGLLSLQ